MLRMHLQSLSCNRIYSLNHPHLRTVSTQTTGMLKLRAILKTIPPTIPTITTNAAPKPGIQSTMTTTSDTSITEPHLLRQVNAHQLRAYSTQASGPTYHLRILESIKEDHREISACGEQILQSNDADEQTRAQNMFTWELARHSVAEELVLYPAMERYLEGERGREMAEKDREEHQTVLALVLHTYAYICSIRACSTRANKNRSRISYTPSKPSNPRTRASAQHSNPCWQTSNPTPTRKKPPMFLLWIINSRRRSLWA